MRMPLLASVARLVLVATLALGVAAPALGQDDFDIDDILGSDDPAPAADSVSAEKRDVLRGDLDDQAGTASTELETPDEKRRRIRPIKVLQPKNFLKLGRWDLAPHIGFITSDPFLNRYLVGASITYHATEILGIEASFTYSPDLGEGDYKAITKQLVNENQVSPDITKILWFAEVDMVFSPIYGKVAVAGKNIGMFDIYGLFGAGITQTKDDLDALQRPDDPVAQATQLQIHPTSNFGAGARIMFGKSIALRIEGRSMIYIETVASTTLELKNMFMLKAAVSFFFPGMK